MGIRGAAGALALLALSLPGVAAEAGAPIEVPLLIDHGRLLVEAEARLTDGSWSPVKLWIDTGTPGFILSPDLARKAVPGLSGAARKAALALRLGGSELDLAALPSIRTDAPAWLFAATGAQANLPATVLSRYRALFDFPGRRLVLNPRAVPAAGRAPAGAVPTGSILPASVDRSTGIVAIEASLGGRALNLALDLGASFSFLDADLVAPILAAHPEWPSLEGAVGEANMWGWYFPREADWSIYRPDALVLGEQRIEGAAFAALPRESIGGLGPWYSQKTAVPVAGFLGPNAFRAFRLEIDYEGGTVRLERAAPDELCDLDTVGFGLLPRGDGSYEVSSVARRRGASLAPGVEAGDRILSVDGRPPDGLTMGGAAALLRGEPGGRRRLVLIRRGARLEVWVPVLRLP